MKSVWIFLAISLFIFGCGSGNVDSSKTFDKSVSEQDTVRIANDSLEYEIIIVEPGFNTWLISQPPKGYYGQTYLETKNRMFVADYNSRVLQPAKFSPSLYPEQINYDPTVDYGYDVNYLLFNYFMYFQEKYNQQLTGGRK